MAEKNSLCVVIPVHKPVITIDEQVSLNACKAHLNKYDCFLIFPDGMDTKAYTDIFKELLPVPVNQSWLISVGSYNKMKLNPNFYKIFRNYNFMLTYELDAYIFSSDFESANAFSFDYIGAPFFEGYWAAEYNSPFAGGCNSGFSIRNVQSCIQVLNNIKKYRFHWIIYRIFLSRISYLRLKLNQWTKKKYEVFITGRFAFYFDNFHLNEDVIWSEVVPKLFPEFKVADPMSALRFSFECNLEKSLALNCGHLPLGCHAWYKYYDFWEKYIDTDIETKKP